MLRNEAEFRKKILDMGEMKDDSFVSYGMTPAKPMGSIPRNFDPNYTSSLGYAINKPFAFVKKNQYTTQK